MTDVTQHTVRPLDASTWDAFAELVERNNGVFGGCWCIGFHPESGRARDRLPRRSRRTGSGPAARTPRWSSTTTGLAQGWCQYGSPEELPGIKHRREYDKDAAAPPGLADHLLLRRQEASRSGRRPGRRWRARWTRSPAPGGGLVEAIPEVTAGRQAPGRFLFSATVELFEEYGFTRVRQVGKHAWILTKVIEPA